MRLSAALAATVILATACGTGGTDLSVDEPTRTLFDDQETATDETETASPEAPTAGSAELGTSVLPPVRATGEGIVVIEGVALAVDEVTEAGWVATSPCGIVFSGDAPIERALVVIDPGGDTRDQIAGTAPVAAAHTIGEMLVSELAAADVSAVLTRGEDHDIAASVRARAAAASGAVVVVSIVFAEGGDTSVDAPPLEVVHPAAASESRRLAGLVHQSLDAVLRSVPAAWTDGVEPGVRAVLNQRGTDFFSILREAERQARVVVHLPALTADTTELLASPVTAVSVAQGLADAIARFLVTDEEGGGFVTPPEVVRQAATAGVAAECVDPLGIEPAADDE